MSSWFLLRSGRGSTAFNMALDEALLVGAAELGQPVLRCYGWIEAAASFGYFQKIAEVERATLLRPLVRRPTGGGFVPHDADWTYSLVFPPTHPWHKLKAVESDRQLHHWLQAALASLNLATDLALVGRKEIPGQCFAGHEQFDLLWQGRKIAGAAQRRTRTGLLIQGSIQPPPPGIKRADFETALLRLAEQKWRIGWRHFHPPATLLEEAHRLVREKYSLPTYHRRR